MSVAATYKVDLSAKQTAPGQYGGQMSIAYSRDVTLASGTTSTACDRMHHSTQSLATGANADVRLTTLTDAYGNVMGLAEIRWLRIHNPSTNDGTLEFKGSAATGWCGAGYGITKDVSDIVVIEPGCSLILDAIDADGKYVVDATHRDFNVLNNGSGTVAYVLQILGVSA